MLYNIKKFSVKIFLLICVFVVFPLIGVSIYITRSMEKFLQNQMTDNVFQNISRISFVLVFPTLPVMPTTRTDSC